MSNLSPPVPSSFPLEPGPLADWLTEARPEAPADAYRMDGVIACLRQLAALEARKASERKALDDDYAVCHGQDQGDDMSWRGDWFCPECGTTPIDAPGGGVKCPACGWWACY